jgi:hypothetical protein
VTKWPPHHFDRRARSLLCSLALALIVLSPASGGIGAPSYDAPSTVASDCSVDVTNALLSWIGTIPNNSTLVFRSGGCYRIEGTLEFRNRTGLTFEGNGATFQSFDAPEDQRALWRAVDSASIAFRNMTIKGSYANGGLHDPSTQHAHAIDLRGTSAEVANVTMSDLAGDCIYFGLGYTSALNPSSGSVADSNCLRIGRNAISVTAGNDIRVERVTTDKVGFIVFDVEPNIGPGWGAQRVTFDHNTIGSYYLYAYAIVENASIADQTFSNNRIGVGRYVAGVVNPGASVRPRNVTITGNSLASPESSPAMEFRLVDGLTVTGNTVPMAGGTMATVDGSCSVDVSGNSYSGGSSEVLIRNTPASCQSDTLPPTLTGFTPSNGPVGTSVTLIGENLSDATGVALNGAPASFTVTSDTEINAVVPAGASTGPLSVTTGGGATSTSTAFTVGEPVPGIGSFTPARGPVGTVVTIRGVNFATATRVAFRRRSASFIVLSARKITATVPRRARSGRIRVTTPGGTATSSTRFRVTKR